MLKQGIHPKIVSERLGHKKVGITLDTYSHVVPGLQEKAVEDFANINVCNYGFCIKILAYPCEIERSQKHERNQV